MSYRMNVSFEMKDGRNFECVYDVRVTPGNTYGPPENCYPDESDVGEPEYFIEGDEVEYKSLPKGLDAIADAMYNADESDKRFKFEQEDLDDGPPDDFGSYEERSYYDY